MQAPDLLSTHIEDIKGILANSNEKINYEVLNNFLKKVFAGKGI
jgi:hypothetical protein